MKKILLLTALVSTLFFPALQSREDVMWEHPSYHDIDRHKEIQVIEWAKDNLSQKGVLKQGPDGYVYLKVDNDYIDKLFPQLAQPGYVKPPYFRRSNSPGAHISIFYVDEADQIGKINELGKTYRFKINKLNFVPPKSHEYIVVDVVAPELEQLRQRYGLSPLLQGHNFHITIAKKKYKKFRSE